MNELIGAEVVIELKIEIKQTEPPTEELLKKEIQKAKNAAQEINADDISDKLETLETQLENEKGSADGKLKLNTDVLMNNGAGIGGSGEFPIRGQLFSGELEEQNQKLKENQEQLAKQKQTIQFEEKSTQSLNMKPAIKNLFQEMKIKGFNEKLNFLRVVV